MAVTREAVMLASELKSHLVNKLKDSAADGKTKSHALMSRHGRVQSFMLLFWVGSGWVTLLVGRVGSSQENWTKVQLCCSPYARIMSIGTCTFTF